MALFMVLKYVFYCSFFYNNSIISEVYKQVIKPLLLLFLKYVAQTEVKKSKEKLIRTGLAAFETKAFS